jgi:hypothetical protein
MPRQRTAAFSTPGLRASASTAALGLSPSKKKTTSRSLTNTWCRSIPNSSTSKGGPLVDEPLSLLGYAASDRDNHGYARPRRRLGPKPGKQLGDLAQQAEPAKGGDEHALAGVALQDDGLVAVDPFTGSAADLDRREVVERNPEPLAYTSPVQDEFILAEFEPAGRCRAVTSAPDDGIVVQVLPNSFGRQACSSPIV